MSDIKIQHEGREPFRAQIPRSVLRDHRLSFGSRGLFAFLWDLPGGWVIRLAHLAALGPEGRDAVRARLRELERVGAIRIEEQRRDNGTISGKAWIMITPDRWAVEAPLSSAKKYKEIKLNSDIPTMEYSIVGKPAPKVLQGGKVLQKEAAAPRAHARGTADAAAIRSEEKRHHPRRTPSGIECWYASDDAPADAIEATAPPEQIAGAVAAIRGRRNSANKPTSPVPALVKAELERQHREQLAVEQHAATAKQLAAADTLAIDPAAQATGERIRARVRSKISTHQEAAS